MMNKNIPTYIDIACCAILLPPMLMFMPVEYWFPDNPFFVILLFAWLYGIYFINRRLCTPMLFRKKQIYLAGLWMLLAIAVTYGLVLWSRSVSPVDNPFDYKTIGRVRRLSVWFIFFMTACFGFMMGFLIELHKRMLAQQAIESEKNKAELALYKAQINPHFLFNTLNTLYGLMISGSEKAESAFVKFTGLLRYMYSNSTQDKTPVGEEINYIEEYIGLQLLRVNEHTKVCFTHQEDDLHLEIAPMILITFVENAFKYGISSHTDSVITVSIRVADGVLTLVTENPVHPVPPSSKQGIGISNCRKRLDLLYPQAYTLDIQQTGDYYKSVLTIRLKQPE